MHVKKALSGAPECGNGLNKRLEGLHMRIKKALRDFHDIGNVERQLFRGHRRGGGLDLLAGVGDVAFELQHIDKVIATQLFATVTPPLQCGQAPLFLLQRQ